MSKVSFFGLNAFGSPVGVNPLWGSAIGSVSATGTAIAWRALTDADKWKWAELVGTGVSVAAGAGMMFAKKLRGVGLATIFSGIGSQGLLFAERMLMGGGLSGVEMSRVPQLRGLGMVSADNVPQLRGPSAPSLSNPAAAQIAAQVPGINGLSKHFGATLFG